MEKFEINFNNLKLHVFFESILRKSEVAIEYENIKDFYTSNNKPEDWWIDYMDDIRSSAKCEYKDHIFYVVYGEGEYSDCIAFIFYGGCVYSFDEYYTGCPIFSEILSI